jgi:putative intracellular protease/amidase
MTMQQPWPWPGTMDARLAAPALYRVLVDNDRSRAQRFVVVVFDGVSLGIMSFAFGVFDMAKHYGVLPDLDVRVVSGEPTAALSGGGLSCEVPYDLYAIRAADLVIVPNWRDPAEAPPPELLEALRAAHAAGTRIAGMCSGVFVLAAAGCSMIGRPRRIGRWPGCSRRCIRRSMSGRRRCISTTAMSSPLEAAPLGRIWACTCSGRSTARTWPTGSPVSWWFPRTGSATRRSTWRPRCPSSTRPIRWARR